MLANLIRRPEIRDVGGQLGFPDWLNLWQTFGYGGVSYQVPPGNLTQVTAIQSIRNPIILRCILMRGSVFSQVRLRFQDMPQGREGAMFGGSGLSLLEHPWPGASTSDLLFRMELDISMYGNSYWYPSAPDTLTWIDPNRIKIFTGDVTGPSGATVGAKLLGYQTQSKNGQPVETFLPSEIVHYAPIPDPHHPFRGLSWLASLLPDVSNDADMTDFKRGYLRNSATPNLVVTMPANINADALRAFVDKVETAHVGPQAAFKTLYVSNGADVKTVGSNWGEMQLVGMQSYQDTRLCLAAGVPASLAGIAEGLKGSALNAGNYAATRRSFADITVRQLWDKVCPALEKVAPRPYAASRLWYEERGVAFLQADMTDAATTRRLDAQSISLLILAGMDPDSARDAVVNDDMTMLKHTGLVSVQLQPLAGMLLGQSNDQNGNGQQPAAVGAGDGNDTNQ